MIVFFLLHLSSRFFAPRRRESRCQSGRRDRHGDVSDGDRQGHQEVHVSLQPGELLGSGGSRRHPEQRCRSVSEKKDSEDQEWAIFIGISIGIARYLDNLILSVSNRYFKKIPLILFFIFDMETRS